MHNQTAINFSTLDNFTYPTTLHSCFNGRKDYNQFSSKILDSQEHITKKVTWSEIVKQKNYTPSNYQFVRRSEYPRFLSPLRIKKIKIIIPIIKYVDHIKKYYNDRPYQLIIELYCIDQQEAFSIKNKELTIKKYHIEIKLVVNICMNISEKIYLSIYMIDKFTQMTNQYYTSLNDLFDWTYEFHKISDLLVSEEKYNKLKNKYRKYIESQDINQKLNHFSSASLSCDDESFGSSSFSFSSDEESMFSDNSEETSNDLDDINQSQDLHFHQTHKKEINEKNTDKQAIYFLADFFLDNADLNDNEEKNEKENDRSKIITLKDFFTQSSIEYHIFS